MRQISLMLATLAEFELILTLICCVQISAPIIPCIVVLVSVGFWPVFFLVFYSQIGDDGKVVRPKALAWLLRTLGLAEHRLHDRDLPLPPFFFPPRVLMFLAVFGNVWALACWSLATMDIAW